MMTKFKQEMAAFFQALYQGDPKVLVFGEGTLGAQVMLIGEAPGEQEVLAGRPFVGAAGKNLDAFLAASGFSRDALYITNVVKFRPVKASEKGRLSNRTPTREEVALFVPWLVREIELVSPKLVVTLGNTALRAILGDKVSIGDMHGEMRPLAQDRLLIPLYHPASVIYNRALRQTYMEDVQRLGQWREQEALRP